MNVSIASLGEDVQVATLDCYGTFDGGHVIWMVLKDALSNCCTICLDNRRASPTCHRLFEGARHPSDPRAVLIELGAEEEGIIVPMLSRWLDSAEPWGLGAYSPVFRELLQEALLRIGEPLLAPRL